MLIQCPNCRGYELKRRYCVTCNSSGFIRTRPQPRQTSFGWHSAYIPDHLAKAIKHD